MYTNDGVPSVTERLDAAVARRRSVQAAKRHRQRAAVRGGRADRFLFVGQAILDFLGLQRESVTIADGIVLGIRDPAATLRSDA
ncbi:MAG: hypothetical protein WD336_09180, partial [Trueperaceae bacterium]